MELSVWSNQSQAVNTKEGESIRTNRPGPVRGTLPARRRHLGGKMGQLQSPVWL